MTAGRPNRPDRTEPPELATLLLLLGHRDDGPDDRAVTVPWAPAGAGAPVLLRHTARRIAVTGRTHLVAALARRPLTVVRPVRGSLQPGMRDRFRRRAGSGWVAVPSGSDTLVGQLVREARADPLAPLSVGADGAVRVPVRRDGDRALLRMGLTGTPADPCRAAEGLRALAAADVPLVPRVVDGGQCARITWRLEEMLDGRRPHALTPAFVDRTAAFLASLPPADGVSAGGAAAAVRADGRLLAGLLPGGLAGRVHAAADGVADAPIARRGRLAHGDLWAGNLLADGEELTGVVDWDAWTPSGLPGVDLLHLLATHERIRTRSPLGAVWTRRPWDHPAFAGPAARHWPEWGGDPAARRMVGTAWWAGQLAADLRRNPTLAHDERWVARNVTAVAELL